MLLSFSVEGYKMYVQKATLSMETVPKLRDLEYSLLREKVAGKVHQGICSAVIYGPNAAGKSALVSALRSFRAIVMRGSITAKGDGHNLALIPTSFDVTPRPTAFELSFTKDGVLYRYALTADLGRFGRLDEPRRVIAERLEVDGKPVFVREGDEVSIKVHPTLESRFSKAYLDNRAVADSLMSVIDATNLFLTNGFRTIVSPVLAREVISWFAKDLIVVDSTSESYAYPLASEDNIDRIEAHLTETARFLGVSNRGAFTLLKRDELDASPELYSCVSTPYGSISLPSTTYESHGTMRFLTMLPFVESTLTEGKTLVVDELDASIHPMAVMSIVNAFHDDSVNVRHAQLVFTTHNPIYLDSNLFRRDEIKFVDRDDDTGQGITYALSDFGTLGASGVHRRDDYQQKYLMGRYGAIKDIDLAPFLKEQVLRKQHRDSAPNGNGDAASCCKGRSETAIAGEASTV